MPSYQYRKSHCGDKEVVRSSYLHNGISYTGNMAYLYWTSPLSDVIVTHHTMATDICVSQIVHHWLRYWLVACSAPRHHPNRFGSLSRNTHIIKSCLSRKCDWKIGGHLCLMSVIFITSNGGNWWPHDQIHIFATFSFWIHRNHGIDPKSYGLREKYVKFKWYGSCVVFQSITNNQITTWNDM